MAEVEPRHFHLDESPKVRLLEYRCLCSNGSFLFVFGSHSEAAYRALMTCTP